MKNKDEHVPTQEIMQDIADTQAEIDSYEAERKGLLNSPQVTQENRVRIYILEGRISERELFIEKLNMIIEGRKRRTIQVHDEEDFDKTKLVNF